MIVLDTNVISELMRSEPNPGMLAWLDAQRRRDLCTTAITVAEIAAGIAVLPAGARRDSLENVAARLFREFNGRIIPFTTNAAPRYGAVINSRAKIGRPISTADAEIAAIAIRADAVIATRNVRDFEGTGARVLNPWLPEEEQ